MSSSFKTRLRKRKARNKRAANKAAIRSAVHEVGHYVTKSRLYPNRSFELSLERKGGHVFGKLIDLENPDSLDPPIVMIEVSIAGVIFESFRIDLLDSAFDRLMNTNALRSDRDKFVYAKGQLKLTSGSPYAVFDGIDLCFASVLPQIIKDLEDFGWINVQRLASKLVKERKVVL